MSNTLLLGTLLTQLRTDASGMKQGTKEATAALKKVQDESQKTREVLKRAFAAEALVGGLRRVTDELGKVQNTGVQAFAAVGSAWTSMLQGGMQAGPWGAIVSGLSAIGTEGVKAWNAVEDAAREAFEAAAMGHANEAAALAKMQADLAGAERTLSSIGSAMASGKTVEQSKMLEEIARTGKEYRDAKAAMSIFDAQAAYVKKGLPDAHDPTSAAADKRAEIAGQLAGIEGQRKTAQEGVDKLGVASDKAVADKLAADAMTSYDKQRKWLEEETAYRKQAAQSARTFAYQNELQAKDAKRQSQIDSFARVNRDVYASAHDFEDRGARMTRDQNERWNSIGGGAVAAYGATDAELAGKARAALAEAFAAMGEGGSYAGLTASGGGGSVGDRYGDFTRSASSHGNYGGFGGFGGFTNGAQESSGYIGGETTFPEIGMISEAGSDFVRVLGEITVKLTGAFEGPIRALAAGSLAGLANGLLGFVMQSKAIQGVMAAAEPILQSFADNLGLLFAPFVPMIERLGAFLGPVFNALGDGIARLYPVFGVLGGALAGLEWVLEWAKNQFFEMTAWVLDKINIGDASSRLLELEAKARAHITEQGTLQGAVLAGYHDVTRLSVDKFRESVDKATESMVNLPAGFKIAAARYGSTQVDAGDVGAGRGSGMPGARGNDVGSQGGTQVHIDTVNVAANTLAEIVKELEGKAGLAKVARFGVDTGAQSDHPYGTSTLSS